MSFSDWMSLITTVATACSAIATGFAAWVVYSQLGKLSRQITLQTFADYTKRYQSIILNLPEDINASDFVLNGDRSDYTKTMRYMRAYFDLCFEEWDLNRLKMIDTRHWSVWRGGIETALSKPAFKQAWEIIRKDTRFGREFESFVEGCSHTQPL